MFAHKYESKIERILVHLVGRSALLCLCLLSTHADCFNPYLNFHLLNFYSPYQELRINVRQKNNRNKKINIYSTQSKQAEYCDLQERAKSDQLLSLLLELLTLSFACLLHTRANSVKPPPFPFIPLQRSEITSISHTAKGTPEIFLVSVRHLSQRKRTPKHKQKQNKNKKESVVRFSPRGKEQSPFVFSPFLFNTTLTILFSKG